jgi:hypothetical protein
MSEPQALDHIQGLRDEIGRFRFEWDDKVFRLEVSFGVTELHSGMTDIGEILAQADTACYHAKSLGGSAIQVYEKTHPALQKINNEMQWVGAITKAFLAAPLSTITTTAHLGRSTGAKDANHVVLSTILPPRSTSAVPVLPPIFRPGTAASRPVPPASSTSASMAS